MSSPFLNPTIDLDPNQEILTALTVSSSDAQARSFCDTFQGVDCPSALWGFRENMKNTLAGPLCPRLDGAGYGLGFIIVANSVDVATRAIASGLTVELKHPKVIQRFNDLKGPDRIAVGTVRSTSRLAYAHHPNLEKISDATIALLRALHPDDYPSAADEVVKIAAGYCVARFDTEYWAYLNGQ